MRTAWSRAIHDGPGERTVLGDSGARALGAALGAAIVADSGQRTADSGQRTADSGRTGPARDAAGLIVAVRSRRPGTDG
ncbi:hypothetical protein ACWEFL_23610 [Streptomyces sp. NPDC004838]